LPMDPLSLEKKKFLRVCASPQKTLDIFKADARINEDGVLAPWALLLKCSVRHNE